MNGWRYASPIVVPLSLGMKSPLETYGFNERSGPSQASLKLYENYAAASSINSNPEVDQDSIIIIDD